MRASGILLPVSSIPSNYGIGCFSKEAYSFVDQLVRGGQKYWQILPLGPTGYGDSPYQSFSTFAGNPYFIDLEVFIREGLLFEHECHSIDWGGSENYVDYAKIYESRFQILRLAFSRWSPERNPEYVPFLEENEYWLQDYCLYMAIKNDQGGKGWNEWPDALKNREPDAIAEAEKRLDEEIRFFRFQQFFVPAVQHLRVERRLHLHGRDHLFIHIAHTKTEAVQIDVDIFHNTAGQNVHQRFLFDAYASLTQHRVKEHPEIGVFQPFTRFGKHGT